MTATKLIEAAKASLTHNVTEVPVDVGRRAWRVSHLPTSTHYVLFLVGRKLDTAYRADGEGNLLCSAAKLGSIATQLELA